MSLFTLGWILFFASMIFACWFCACVKLRRWRERQARVRRLRR